MVEIIKEFVSKKIDLIKMEATEKSSFIPSPRATCAQSLPNPSQPVDSQGAAHAVVASEVKATTEPRP